MSRARQQEWLRVAMIGAAERQRAREAERRERLRERKRAARRLLRVRPWGARFTLRPSDLRWGP